MRTKAIRIGVAGVAGDYVAREAGRLLNSARGRGRNPGLADMLIAATARVHGLTLLTRKVCDFDRCGVEVVDPFEGMKNSLEVFLRSCKEPQHAESKP